MSDLRKAAEMALDGFEKIHKGFGAIKEESKFRGDEDIKDLATEVRKNCNKHIKALRQALAQPEQDKLLKQGWRQCAVGQRTTQYCGMAEQARLEEREACLKEIAIELDEWGWGNNANIALNNVAANIRTRSEK